MAMTPAVELAVKLGAAAGHASLGWQLWTAWRNHELRLRLDTVTDPAREGIDLTVFYKPRRLDRRLVATVVLASPQGPTVASVERLAQRDEATVAGRQAEGPMIRLPTDEAGDVGAQFNVRDLPEADGGRVRVRVIIRTDTGRKLAALTRTISRV